MLHFSITWTIELLQLLLQLPVCHQDLSWREFKERYLRPNYLQASFTLGALTIGLRVAAANYAFETTVSVLCC
jgi:hypothetical protein